MDEEVFNQLRQIQISINQKVQDLYGAQSMVSHAVSSSGDLERALEEMVGRMAASVKWWENVKDWNKR